jgi:hypothetical protein
MKRLRISFAGAGVSLVAGLNESSSAAALWDALPVDGSAQTWGAEVYFSVPFDHDPEDPQATVETGTVGYWPPGSAVCLFFGQQPVSPVNPLGTVEGDPTVLARVEDGDLVRLERLE